MPQGDLPAGHVAAGPPKPGFSSAEFRASVGRVVFNADGSAAVTLKIPNKYREPAKQLVDSYGLELHFAAERRKRPRPGRRTPDGDTDLDQPPDGPGTGHDPESVGTVPAGPTAGTGTPPAEPVVDPPNKPTGPVVRSTVDHNERDQAEMVGEPPEAVGDGD